MSRPDPTARVVLTAATVRGVLLGGVWWVVAEGSAVVAWPHAAAVVLAATAVSLWLVPARPRRRLRPAATLSFAGWFVWT
ncbi:hypothetical protein [Trujillonella humicola]|uniref:hypothetical protein n=1 Tax=Trujillonella humicola TaxID=3383699 RepID=UPI00390699D7